MGQQANRLSEQLREIARIGVVNYKQDTAVIREAARTLDEQEKRIEELEERVAIMAADMDQTQMDAVKEMRFP